MNNAKGCCAQGLFWELNPGPLAPEARIMPLDQTAMISCVAGHQRTNVLSAVLDDTFFAHLKNVFIRSGEQAY